MDAPHPLDVEVLSVLRRLLFGGKLESAAAEDARRDHVAFTITRHETGPLADRIWQLRHHYTSHDASHRLMEGVGHPAAGQRSIRHRHRT